MSDAGDKIDSRPPPSPSTPPEREAKKSSFPPIPSMRPAAGASMSPEGDPLIGRVLNERVKIVRAIARGGMGKVYLGEQLNLGRPCAIKVLDPRAAGAEGEDFNKRFLLEASVTAKLTHPNAVTIFDYGDTEDGICFIAMEYLNGVTLADELKKLGKLAPERAVHIARQICRALREAHGLGVVHRDMKPGNVFLVQEEGKNDEGDFIKVLDFGLVKETSPRNDAQHTQVGQIMGSPKYMAPEQIQGKDVDGRTDIYALGCVLYAMITGHPPFERPNEMSTMMAHVSEPVPPLAAVVPELPIPAGLEPLIMQCLAKDPAQRYASMDDLLVALKLQGAAGVFTTTGSGQTQSPYVTKMGSGSGTHRAVVESALSPPVEPPPRKGFSPLWIVGGVVAVAIAAILFVTRNNGAPPETVATTTTTAARSSGLGASATSAPPATSSAAPAPIPTIVLSIVTDPPGAKVKEEGITRCEKTPCEIVYKGAEADAALEHFLEFRKADYKVERKLVKAGGKEPYTLKMTKE